MWCVYTLDGISDFERLNCLLWKYVEIPEKDHFPLGLIINPEKIESINVIYSSEEEVFESDGSSEEEVPESSLESSPSSDSAPYMLPRMAPLTDK